MGGRTFWPAVFNMRFGGNGADMTTKGKLRAFGVPIIALGGLMLVLGLDFLNDWLAIAAIFIGSFLIIAGLDLRDAPSDK